MEVEEPDGWIDRKERRRIVVEVFWSFNGHCSCAGVSLGMVAGLQAGDTVPIQDLPEASRDLVLGTAKVLIDATIFKRSNEVLSIRSGEGAEQERRRGGRRPGCEDVNQAQGFRGAKSEEPPSPNRPRGVSLLVSSV